MVRSTKKEAYGGRDRGKRNCQGVSVVKRDIGHYHVVETAGLLKWKDIPTGVLKTGTFSMLAFGRLVIAEK